MSADRVANRSSQTVPAAQLVVATGDRLDLEPPHVGPCRRPRAEVVVPQGLIILQTLTALLVVRLA